MMTAVKDIPLDWIYQLLQYTVPRRPHGRDARAYRDAVADWAKDLPSRMSPWGVQFYARNPRAPHDGESWVPPMPHGAHQQICGRWIRDFELDTASPGHSRSCRCDSPPEPCIRLNDAELWSGGAVLSAYQHGEIADSTIDMAGAPCQPIASPRNRRCLLTELPVEILDHIIAHLVPSGHTYHFFPARSGKATLQVVQKLLVDTSARTSEYLDLGLIGVRKSISPANPVTVHTGLAGASRALQHLLYSRLYSKNKFIFHLTSYTIHPSIFFSSSTDFQSWSRTYRLNQSGILGPLMARAAAHLRDLTIVATLPPSHTSQDIATLEQMVRSAAGSLIRLDNFALHLHISEGHLDPRYSVTALPIDLLCTRGSDGRPEIGLKENTCKAKRRQHIRESSRTQQVLRPLLNDHQLSAKVVTVNGAVSEGFKTRMQSAFQHRSHAGAELLNMSKDEHEESRPVKRRRC